MDAFRSTLEEVCAADLLLQVVDVSDPHYREQMDVTKQTLADLGAGDISMITVYNKADLAPEDSGTTKASTSHTAPTSRIVCESSSLSKALPIINREQPSIRMAAGLGIGLDELLDLICEQLFGAMQPVRLLLPYQEAALYERLSRESDITVTKYQEDGIYVEAKLSCRGSLHDVCLKYFLH